ncbi:MAG: DUF3667 domain-containing protein [Puniceicoccaceae bacterium]
MPSDEHSGQCRNCGTTLKGDFCHVCGQSSKLIRRPTLEILKEAVSHILHLDSKLFLTLKLLLFRPGRLALDWTEGKRARYVPPFRLYIIASFFLFLLVSFANRDVEMEVAQFHADEEEIQALQTELNNARESNDWLTAVFLQGAVQAIEDPAEYNRKMIKNLPKAAFLLLPVFALIHMLINIRQKRFYVDYLVYSLNFHSFSFALLSVNMVILFLIPQISFISVILYLPIPAYAAIGFRTFHNQGWLKSIIKAFLALGIYCICLLFSLALFFALVLFL